MNNATRSSDGKIIVCIDIGTSKVVTLIAKVNEYINVLGVSEVKSQGVRKGQIVDIEDAVSAINASLEAAERMAGFSASRVIVSIGGGHIESLNSKGVVAVSSADGEINATDLIRVIDAAKAVSLSSTREVIHVLPRNYTVDGQEGIRDPIGMTGVRLEVDTHIITANTTSVKNLEKALSEVGVDVESIVFSGYGSSMSVLSDTEKELGVVLVDIGAGTTDISVYVEGSVAYSCVLPIGARHITNDLAIGLRISLESAEKIKLFLSNATARRQLNPEEVSGLHEAGNEKAVEAMASKTDEVDLSFLGLPEEVRKVSKKTLVDGIIRPRLNEIFTMVGLEVKKSGYAGQTPAGLVICGGGAKTVGIQDAAKRTLAMPVRVGYPQKIKGIIDEIQDPAFGAVVGLAMYGEKSESSPVGAPFGFSLPGLPKNMKMGNLPSKILSFIKSFIP
ncbi:MAG: cell division protein FtsA [Candidatus Levybacteria bacterium]|nr:cell division protein FtsA [Candidatus Levybacteria bacterium]